jgi:hypothetical protein
MNKDRSFLKETIASLKQQRDELALQAHLGKAELKEEWDRLQDKWAQLAHEYEPVKDALEDTTEGVVIGLALIAGELKAGFKRMKDALTS